MLEDEKQRFPRLRVNGRGQVVRKENIKKPPPLPRPTSVKVTRLDDGCVRVEYNAPIKVSTLDLVLMGYRRTNRLLADAEGYCVGFEMNINEYKDMMSRRLKFKKKDVKATPWATDERTARIT